MGSKASKGSANKRKGSDNTVLSDGVEHTKKGKGKGELMIHSPRERKAERDLVTWI